MIQWVTQQGRAGMVTSSIVVTSHRQAELWEPDCSVAALLPPLLGELTEPSPSLLQGPNFWAVTGAGFWKSRALSQLLPS